ncbi:ABC transporter ATP-binding protein [Fictibacillus iocasae]|uniref:ABC transporter ATP-binding protein n=1 Tax=Fictibacillus iocasae TaxID=2715437 RepID=A0ABW2NLW1_9BACL
MLAVQQLERVFNDGSAGFRNISFTVQDSEVIGILGTSGCGKSTLLRVLAGLDPNYTGKLRNANNNGKQPGMMFQEPRLMPWLNVRENIAFGLKNKEEQSKEVQQFIDLVGLTGFEEQYPKDLSGGMAQRTAIARALITNPSVLLLDEPFSALDAFTKMQLQDLLLSLWEERKTTMVLVTHDIDEALYLCDRIFVLKGQPGEQYAEIILDIQKPRQRGSVELAERKSNILNLLDVSRAGGGLNR